MLLGRWECGPTAADSADPVAWSVGSLNHASAVALPQVDEAFQLVRERVRLELQSQQELGRIQGMLEPLLTAAAAAAGQRG